MRAVRAALALLVAVCAVASWGALGAADNSEQPADRAGLIDPAFTASPRWNDGLPEIAFYEIRIEGESRRLLAESVLSRHLDDRAAFHWRFFYEFFEGSAKSYHAKGSEHLWLAAEDLRPLKRSRGGSSWEGGGCCRVGVRRPDGRFHNLDGRPPDREEGTEERAGERAGEGAEKGTRDVEILHPARSYPSLPRLYLASQIPLLVRALDFSRQTVQRFSTVVADGRLVPVEAERVGEEPVETGAGPIRAEKIVVRYELPEPPYLLAGLILGAGADEETYWRGMGPDRPLLRWDTRYDGRRLTVALVEAREHLEPDRGPARSQVSLPPAPAAPNPTDPEPATEGVPLEGSAPALDTAFLTSPHWNDGRSEIAYYRVRTAETGNEEVLAVSILTKEPFHPVRGLKTTTEDPEHISIFLSIFQYESGAGATGRSRRFWASRARQSDLRPYSSASSHVTWDGQCGRSVSIRPDGTVRVRTTSCTDLLPEEAPEPFVFPGSAFLPAQIPLVVRALDFSKSPVHELAIVHRGRSVSMRASLAGVEEIELQGRPVRAERILVRYSEPLRSDHPAGGGPLGDTGREETYWRGTGPQRQLLAIRGDRAEMTLIEEIRARHWAEDFYPRLRFVRRYP